MIYCSNLQHGPLVVTPAPVTSNFCFAPGLHTGAYYWQQMQNVSVEQLNSRILELQMQQCCCNQITALNERLTNMVNASPVQCFSSELKRESRDFVYDLDRILFPDNPIRDYIEEEIRQINEKYESRIKALNALLT